MGTKSSNLKYIELKTTTRKAWNPHFWKLEEYKFSYSAWENEICDNWYIISPLTRQSINMFYYSVE